MQRLTCPTCGDQGDYPNGFYATAAVLWNPRRKRWEVVQITSDIDCTRCDVAWPLGPERAAS